MSRRDICSHVGVTPNSLNAGRFFFMKVIGGWFRSQLKEINVGLSISVSSLDYKGKIVIKIANMFFETVVNFRYFGRTLTDGIYIHRSISYS
jgi:hypothetical protein